MKGEIAKGYFLQGLNCCQAVVLAFKGELKLSEDDIKRLAVGFGGGLARQRLTCGAVSGMAMVIGALHADKGKAETYAIIQKACEEFKAETGSLICAEMLSGEILKDKSAIPEARTPEYYKKRPCVELVGIAADILDAYLESHPL